MALWLTNETENVRAVGFDSNRSSPLTSATAGPLQVVLQLACALIGVTAVNIDVTLGFPAVL